MRKRQWVVAGLVVSGLGLVVAHSTALSARIERAQREVAYDGASPHGPTDPEVQKGLDAYSSGDYAQVRRVAEGLLAKRNRGSTHAEAVDMLVESWLAQGEFAKARAAATAHRRQAPQASREALDRIAEREQTYQRELGRYRRQEAAARKPEEAAASKLRIGHLYRQYGQLALAVAAYRGVVSDYPGTEAARRAQRQLDSVQATPLALGQR
jgi:TolA-binding protein